MITDNLIVDGFEPLFVTVDNIGPFRTQPYEIDFTDDNGDPCNLFLLLSKNGAGKTTLLEILARLMDFVFHPEPKHFGHEDFDQGKGRVQWDIRLKATWRETKMTVLLSMLAGSLNRETPAIKEWSEKSLDQYGISHWYRIGHRRGEIGGKWRPVGKTDEFMDALIGMIQAETALSSPPAGFEEPILTLPRVLFFSAYRNIERVESLERSIARPENWGYSPAYEIPSQGSQWKQSLDNLLVWLKWLDDGRFERARDIVNKRVFDEGAKFLADIRKDPPEAIVNSGGEKHRLDRLSSGEKSLVHLFLRIGAHMTQNTIILIDELDVHLHPNWQHRIIAQFKAFVRDYPGVTVITSTHSREILGAFPLDIPEPGVRKGGEIIKQGITL